ncbi:MAG: toxic anion resistance protein [Gammaproteobacteria bacterium]|nr:toxic anion resistance protein [Gammaproteobacteria bacterium]
MSTVQTTAKEKSAPLRLDLDVDAVKDELLLPADAPPEVDPELDKLAEDYANRLVTLDPSQASAKDEAKDAVEDMGRSLQREAARRSQMLQQPIKALSEHGGEGGPVANALIELKMKVEELDPNRFDFSPGWFTRLLGMLPGVGTPLKRYFTRFESAQTVIDAIIRSLENGRDQLKRDNVTLREDQRAMRELTEKLARQIQLARLLDQKLEYKLTREIPAGDPRHAFIKEELLFPLRQRVMDLQQQLAVNQQGVLAVAIVMRNNSELIRGVDRSLDVTVSALQVAVTVALGLANQKIVLDKVSALNQTTSDLISGTAERLRTQGTAIHAQAAGTMIDLDALKSAFVDINTAMDEIARFRQDALPKMAQAILEFDELTREGEKSMKKLEQAERARPGLRLEAPGT